jgi:hypothetical protein
MLYRYAYVILVRVVSERGMPACHNFCSFSMLLPLHKVFDLRNSQCSLFLRFCSILMTITHDSELHFIYM